MRQNLAQDARYNTAKRQIKQAIDVDSVVRVLVKRDNDTGSYMVREKLAVHAVDKEKASAAANGWHYGTGLSEGNHVGSGDDNSGEYSDNRVTIRVSRSLLSSLKTPAGYFLLQIGGDVHKGHKYLCFSDPTPPPSQFRARPPSGRRDRAGNGKGGGVPLRQLLDAAKTMEDVSRILTRVSQVQAAGAHVFALGRFPFRDDAVGGSGRRQPSRHRDALVVPAGAGADVPVMENPGQRFCFRSG
jgi:hypothetical protein